LHEPLQQSEGSVQVIPLALQPPAPQEPAVHSMLQHSVPVVHEAPPALHDDAPHTALLHTALQQSLGFAQVMPSDAQFAAGAHLEDAQFPLQHCEASPQRSPFEKHAAEPQMLFMQVPLQQSEPWRQAMPSIAHLFPQNPFTQSFLQHSLEAVHAWPSAAHMLVALLPPDPITMGSEPFAHAEGKAARASRTPKAGAKREATKEKRRDMAERYPARSATASRSHSWEIVSSGQRRRAHSRSLSSETRRKPAPESASNIASVSIMPRRGSPTTVAMARAAGSMRAERRRWRGRVYVTAMRLPGAARAAAPRNVAWIASGVR
jgi:hypothetical protein